MRGVFLIGLLLALGVFLASCQAQTVAPASPKNHVNITKTAPMPANFRAYRHDAPWNLRLPEHPMETVPSLRAEIIDYVNVSSFKMIAAAPDFFTNCHCHPGQNDPCTTPVTQDPPHCGGQTGFSMYVASTSDPRVRFVCDATQTNYGCSLHDVTTWTPATSFDIEGYMPANAVPVCNSSKACGDVNFSVLQPDGTLIEGYGCQFTRPIRDGDIVGTPRPGDDPSKLICPNRMGGLALSNVVTDKGVQATTNSGPSTPANVIPYNWVATPTSVFPRAIVFGVSCTAPGFVYPATSDTSHCGGKTWNGRGLKAGTHFFLDLSFAQIDALIVKGTLSNLYRPLYRALHEYGGYLIDTGGGSDPDITIVMMEDSSQWIANGATSPWDAWFQARGGLHGRATGNSPYWIIVKNPFAPLATNMVVLKECYALGTCSDSPPPDVDLR